MRAVELNLHTRRYTRMTDMVSTDPPGGERHDPQGPLDEFMALEIATWEDWLNAVLHSEPHHPDLIRGSADILIDLIGLYCRLNDSARRRFAEAVVRLYESTQYFVDQTPVFYTLLRLLGFVKPSRAKRLLIRDLLSEIFLSAGPGGFVCNQRPLHFVLLSAVAEYEINEAVIDYLFQSAERTTDLAYLFQCFQLLLEQGEVDTYLFLNVIIANLPEDEMDAEGLAQELAVELDVEFRKRRGPREFFLWYSKSALALREAYPSRFSCFERNLKIEALPREAALVEPHTQRNDLYWHLLDLQLYADEQQHSAQ